MDRNPSIEPVFARKGGQTGVLMCLYYILYVHILQGQYDTTFALQNSAKHNTNEHINIEKDIDRHGLGGSTLSLLQK